MAGERRATAEDEVRALRDVAAQVETALRAGAGRAHEGAVPAARLASELKERVTALKRRVLLAAEWAGGAAPGDLAKHAGLLRDSALLAASVAALRAQLSAGRAAMGGRSGGATVEGLTEVARGLGLQWDAQSADEGEVHFSAGNEAFLLDCHAPPPPARPRLELHLMARTPQGPTVLAASPEALADVERAVNARDWATVARVLRYVTRLYAICPQPEARARLEALPAQVSAALRAGDVALEAAPSAEGARLEVYRAPVALPGEAAAQLVTVQADADAAGSELGPSLVYVARFHPPLLLPLPALAHLRALLLPASAPPSPPSVPAAPARPRRAASVASLLGVQAADVDVWGVRLRFDVHEPRAPLLTVLLLPFASLAHAPFIVRLAQQAALYARLLRSCHLPHSPPPPAAPAPPPPASPAWRPVELTLHPPEAITLLLRAGGAFLSLRVCVALGGHVSVAYDGPGAGPVPAAYLTAVLAASHSLPVLLHYLLRALGD